MSKCYTWYLMSQFNNRLLLKLCCSVTALFLLLSATNANAAPFCVATQEIPAQCDYYDVAQCRDRANELRGVCIANQNEIILPQPSGGKYCMVDSSRTALCIYNDRDSCEDEAFRHKAVCIEAVRNQQVQPDPYQNDPSRKY